MAFLAMRFRSRKVLVRVNLLVVVFSPGIRRVVGYTAMAMFCWRRGLESRCIRSCEQSVGRSVGRSVVFCRMSVFIALEFVCRSVFFLVNVDPGSRQYPSCSGFVVGSCLTLVQVLVRVAVDSRRVSCLIRHGDTTSSIAR